MQYLNTSLATINFHEDEKLVEIIWKQTNPESAYYRLTLTKALIVVKNFGAQNWLSDMSFLKAISEDDRHWVESFLVQNAAENGLRKAAFILNDDIYSQIYTDGFEKLVGQNKIEVKSFNIPQKAYEWIGFNKQ